MAFPRFSGTSPLATIALAAALTFVPSIVSAQDQAPAAPSVGYEKGFFIESADSRFRVRHNGRLQLRFTFEDEMGGDPSEYSFSIPRARLVLSGNAFHEEMRYKLELDFGKGGASLKDLWVDYGFVPGWLHLRAGQFKRPFSRQQLTSSSRLELVERSITDKFFGSGRGIGLMLHNRFGRSGGFEYAVGLFNGTSVKPTLSGSVQVDPDTGAGSIESGSFSNVPDFFGPEIAFRLGYNVGGIKGYRESDSAGGGFRFAIAANATIEFDADNDDESGINAGLDWVLKASGFATTGGFYLQTVQDGEAFGDQAYSALGFHAQLGYLIAERVQPVFRYARIVPAGGGQDRQELALGISAYFHGHTVKWQTDGAYLTEQDGDESEGTVLIRSQLQFAF